jgi:hypothetical protein
LAGDQANAVSADGTLIVGEISTSVEPNPHEVIAAIWDETMGWQRIKQILIDSGIEISGWKLTSVVDVSDDGRIIVGNGVNPDDIREAWLVDLSNPTLLPGDYNSDNVVNQVDLDLVLINWGWDATFPPMGWIRNLPGGVDQSELDAVLLNWGNTQPVAGSATAVPEPSAVWLLVLAGSVVLRRRVNDYRNHLRNARPAAPTG